MSDEDMSTTGSSEPGFFASAAHTVRQLRDSVNETLDNTVGRVTKPIMRDGFLAAMWRQGIGEIGEALKAFPDSISHDEPGVLFSPTQGEIAEGRKDHTTVHGDDKEKLPTPGEIAAEKQPRKADQGRQNDHGQDHGRGGGRSM
jgi:hypothetical protein